MMEEHENYLCKILVQIEGKPAELHLCSKSLLVERDNREVTKYLYQNLT